VRIGNVFCIEVREDLAIAQRVYKGGPPSPGCPHNRHGELDSLLDILLPTRLRSAVA